MRKFRVRKQAYSSIRTFHLHLQELGLLVIFLDHTIVHFEIPAEDAQKLKKFYVDLFGWKIEKYPVDQQNIICFKLCQSMIR